VPLVELLGDVLAETSVLVVLDNCEHLLDGAARVAEALVRGGGPRVLATSREPLGAAGETVWRIPPLALPPASEADPERLRAYDAIRLFADRAALALPEFRLDAETAPAVAHICQRLDGLPLALELAAARVRTLPVRRLAEGLDDRFRLLTAGRDGAARQRTLLASVEGATASTRPSAGSSGGSASSPRRSRSRPPKRSPPTTSSTASSLDAARAPRRQEPAALGRPASPARVAAALRVERAARRRAGARARHVAWCRRRAAAWDFERRLMRRTEPDEVGAEAPELFAALDWALQTDPGGVVDLVWVLGTWLGHRGASDALRALARQVLATVAEGSAAWLERLAPLATHLFFAADVSWMPAAFQAMEATPPVGSPVARGFVRLGLAFGPSFVGRPEGLAALEQAADAGRDAGNAHLEGIALLTLASTVSFQGDRARLGPLLAWLDRHVPGDACMRFLLDNAHAWAAAFDGDFARARARMLPYLDEAGPFAIVTQAGMIGLWSQDAVLVDRSIVAAERNASAGAFATSLAWLRAIRPLVAGEVHEVDHLLADDPAPWLMLSASATFRLMAAEIALAQNDDARAARLDDVEPRIADSAFHRYASLVHLLRAEVLRRRGEIRDAEGRAHAGLEIAAEHGLHVVTVEALETLALLADAVHDDAHAARLLGAVAAFRAGTASVAPSVQTRRARRADARLAGAAFDEGRALSLARRRRRVRAPRARRAPPARHRLGRPHADRSKGRRARRRRPHEPRDRREALREPRDRQDPLDPRLHEARRALARRARIRGHEPRHRKEQVMTAQSTAPVRVTVIPTMRYRDAPKMIDWLCTAFAFEKHFVVPGEGGEIAHAQLTFGNGMIMCGSARDDDWTSQSPRQYPLRRPASHATNRRQPRDYLVTGQRRQRRQIVRAR
jgi:hypothetical protein